MIAYKLIDFKGFVCNYDDKIYDVMLEIESNSKGIVFLKNDNIFSYALKKLEMHFC